MSLYSEYLDKKSELLSKDLDFQTAVREWFDKHENLELLQPLNVEASLTMDNFSITTTEELDFEVKKYEEERKRKSKLEEEKYDVVRNKITQQKLEDRKHIKENQKRKKEAVKRFEKEKAKREELKSKQLKKEKNFAEFTSNESLSKIKLPKNGEVEIEIIKNVKSNTALASAALFLTTGILLAEAKEENKWVKTKLIFDDEKIEIKNPHYKIKYKDMNEIQTGQDEDWNLFFMAFDNKKEIYFKTKYEYLYEILNEKLNPVW